MALVNAACDFATQESFGLQQYLETFGTLSSVTTPLKYGLRSLEMQTGAGARLQLGSWADAGSRRAYGIRFDTVGTESQFVTVRLNTGGIIFFLTLLSTGKIRFVDAGNAANFKDGATTIAADTWYRISVSAVFTSTTNWTFKLFLSTTDGEVVSSPEISATNADFTFTAIGANQWTHYGQAMTTWVSPMVGDDNTGLTDIGDQRFTPALFNTESGGVQDFDTAIGAGRGASDYNNVNERALSETNGWRHNGTSQVAETYGVEAAADADVNLTGKTIVGHMAWGWLKKDDTFVPVTHQAATAGTGNTTTTETLLIPTVAVDDILMVTVTSQGHTSGDALVTCTDDDSGGNTWTLKTNSTDRKALLFWKRATSATSAKTITVAGAITKLACNLEVVRGGYTGGDPLTNVSIETNASGDETHATFTPDFGGSLIFLSVHDYGSNNAAASQSTASLGAMTERAEHLPGGAGADAANSIATLDGTNAAAAATGSITWAQTNSTTYSIVGAVRPQETWSTPTAKLVRNGTDEAITITNTYAFYSAITTSAIYPTGVFGMKSTGNYDNTYFGEGGCGVIYIEPLAVSAALTGTITASVNEADIVAGGKTLIITLTGDTWIAAGAGSFDLQRDEIIAGCDSAQSETLGWDLVPKALQSLGGVIRTSDTVVTITWDAFATYNITATETITVTVPGTAVVGGNAIVATPTFTVSVLGGLRLLMMTGLGQCIVPVFGLLEWLRNRKNKLRIL